MFQYRSHKKKSSYNGLTLVELLSALTVMVMLSAALLAVTTTVENGASYIGGREIAAQHGRVVVDRIQRTLHSAHANELFPGFIIEEEQIDTWRFPHTLVVWSPQGDPVDPDGLPRWNEIVIFAPVPNNPTEFAQYRLPGSGSISLNSDGTLNYNFNNLQYLNGGVLTNLVRVGKVSSSGYETDVPAVRFHVVHSPSEADWASYKAGSTAWTDLSWVQDIRSNQTGLRQSWCRFEVQILPGDDAKDEDPTTDKAVPFFGSGALYYQLEAL